MFSHRQDVDIAGRSSARSVKQVWDGENKLFSNEMRQYLENGTLGHTYKVTINH